MPTCLIVQHVPAEGPYLLADALRARGVAVDLRSAADAAAVPADAARADGVVVMGGPMSARTDAGFPTRRVELSLLADAVRRGVPTLGVCLGAQLLAAAAGGSVVPGGAGPEIGWGEVALAPDAAHDPLLGALGDPGGRATVLHWHGETLSQPPGSVHLASSDRYRNQAFRVGARAWGLQFHVEVDLDGVRAFVAAAGEEAEAAGAEPSAIVARAAELLGADGARRWAGRRVADRFADLVAGGAASGPAGNAAGGPAILGRRRRPVSVASDGSLVEPPATGRGARSRPT